MRLPRTGAFPVRGKPFALFAVSLFGVLLSPYLSEIVAFPWAAPFVVLLVLSFVSTVELDDDVLVLTYGFMIKQRIPLDSVEEVTLLSRLDWATVGKYFPQYVLLWLIATLWVAVDLLVFHGGGNPVRIYGNVFVLSTALLLILALTLPRGRKNVLKVFVLLFAVFLFVFYWAVGWELKALSPVFIFLLFAILLVKGFQDSDFILVLAEGKSYLLSSEKPELVLRLIREALGNVPAS